MTHRAIALGTLIANLGCGARSELNLGEFAADAASDRAEIADADALPDAPIDAPTLPTIQLAAGRDHTCFLHDGKLRCWGYGRQGQLCVGSTENALEPIGLPLANVKQVTLGEGSSALLDVEGRVFYCGQDEVTAKNLVKTPTQFAEGAVRLATHTFGRHHCYQDAAGRFHCFGNNAFGQINSATALPVVPPVLVPGLDGATFVTLGEFFTCGAFASDVRCVGRNEAGQLGDGSTTTRSEYRPVSGMGAVRDFGAGYDHACVIDGAGRVSCWGSNRRGQIGDGPTSQLTPRLLPLPFGPARSVRGGQDHTCVLLDDGHVACLGANERGQLGDGTTKPSNTLVLVKNLDDATDLVVGGSHACVQRRAGGVWCWGQNRFGEIGDGTVIDRLEPTRTKL